MAKTRSTRTAPQPLRFAHPFFTTTPLAARADGPFGTRMLDHIESNLESVPKTKGTGVMDLADIIGAAGVQQIAAEGVTRIHAVGDTGRRSDSPQGWVADAMAGDYDAANPGRSPALFLHLGDVIYGHEKEDLYRREFYEPYKHYPGKIIALAGNHDGEVFPQSDPKTLRAFRANFCARTAVVPPIAGTIFRQTMTQPGVYWLLDAPLVQVIGLYSNAAENPGFISGTIPGGHQKKWLVKTLKKIKQQRAAGPRKALVIATHHPPYSAGGHSGSSQMVADIDDACQQAQLMPDAVLAAHAHSYQRYTRRLAFAGRDVEIPFIVAGCGGIGDQVVPAAAGQQTGDHTFDKSRKGFGYLLVEASPGQLKLQMFSVTEQQKAPFDSVTVNLATNRLQ